MSNGDSGMSFVSGFLLGGVLGMTIGVLLAPRSGQETRDGLVEQGTALRQRAEDFAGNLSANMQPTIDNLRQQVGPAVGAVRERMGMEPPPPPPAPEPPPPPAAAPPAAPEPAAPPTAAAEPAAAEPSPAPAEEQKQPMS